MQARRVPTFYQCGLQNKQLRPEHGSPHRHCNEVDQAMKGAPVKATDLDFRRNKSQPKKPRPTPDEYKLVRTFDDKDVLGLRVKIQDICHTEKPGY